MCRFQCYVIRLKNKKKAQLESIRGIMLIASFAILVDLSGQATLGIVGLRTVYKASEEYIQQATGLAETRTSQLITVIFATGGGKDLEEG